MNCVASLVESPSIINLPIVLLNSKRIITHATKPALDLMGFEAPESLIGRRGKDFWVEAERAEPAMEEYERTGYWYGSFLTRHNDGTTFVVHGKAWMIPGTAPDDFATLLLLSKSEAGLQLYSMFGQEGAVVIPEIIARGALHDLNNANMLFSNIVPLMEGDLPNSNPEILELLDMARQSSQHVSDLISKLGVWLQTWTKKDPVRKPTDIGELVRNALGMAMIGGKVQHSFTVKDDLCLVEAEENSLFRVFINLFLNARQAVDQTGNINVVVEHRSADESPLLKIKSVLISISDNGSGMTPHQLKSLFRLGATTKSNGQGVGLAISEHIIRDHGGYIDVQSELHKGTSFQIWLPAIERLPDAGRENSQRCCIQS